MRVAYADGGATVETTGVLLDVYPIGPILDLSGEKTLIPWGYLASLSLVND
jgi:hypothetical protein